MRGTASKGTSLPLETMVFMVLAVIVLAALLFLFSGNVPVAGEKTAKERERSIACSGYTQKDPECSVKDGNPAYTQLNDVRNRVTDACKALHSYEGGYADCTGSASLACVWQCCGTFCRGTARCDELGGVCQAGPCPSGKQQISHANPSCQDTAATRTYICCK